MTLIYSRLPDGSVNPAWMEARRGKITASQIYRIMGKDGPRATYLLELLTERLVGELLEHGGQTAAMQSGIDGEAEAGERYEEETGAVLIPGYWTWHKWGFGATPDFLIDGGGGVEVKVRQPKAAISTRFAAAFGGTDRNATAEMWQCLACAIAMDEPWWDLASRCRELDKYGLGMHITRHAVTDEIHNAIFERVSAANAMLDAQFDVAMGGVRSWVEAEILPRIRDAGSHAELQEAENEIYKLGPGMIPPALEAVIDRAITEKMHKLPDILGA